MKWAKNAPENLFCSVSLFGAIWNATVVQQCRHRRKFSIQKWCAAWLGLLWCRTSSSMFSSLKKFWVPMKQGLSSVSNVCRQFLWFAHSWLYGTDIITTFKIGCCGVFFAISDICQACVWAAGVWFCDMTNMSLRECHKHGRVGRCFSVYSETKPLLAIRNWQSHQTDEGQSLVAELLAIPMFPAG